MPTPAEADRARRFALDALGSPRDATDRARFDRVSSALASEFAAIRTDACASLSRTIDAALSALADSLGGAGAIEGDEDGLARQIRQLAAKGVEERARTAIELRPRVEAERDRLKQRLDELDAERAGAARAEYLPPGC